MPEVGGELMQESEAEAAFKELLQEFQTIAEDEKAEALEDLQEAAEAIEDDERRQEALAQVEQLKQSL